MNLLTQTLSCLLRNHQSPDLVTSPMLYLKQLHAPLSSRPLWPLLQTVTENLVLGIPGSSGEEVGEHPGTCRGGGGHRSKGSHPHCAGCDCYLQSCYYIWEPATQRSNGHRLKSTVTNSYFLKCNFGFPKECLFLFRGKECGQL